MFALTASTNTDSNGYREIMISVKLEVSKQVSKVVKLITLFIPGLFMLFD